MKTPIQVEPSPSDLILERMIQYLAQNEVFDQEAIDQIRGLAETGRLSKPKEVTRAITAVGGTNENHSP